LPLRSSTLVRSLRRLGRRASAGATEVVVRLAAARSPSAGAPSAEPRSIFVLRNNDIGDLLVVTPLFDALRRCYPRAHLAAGVGHWNLEVLRHNPHLSEVLVVDAPWQNKYTRGAGWGQRLRYVRRHPQVAKVSAGRFDVGIDVAGTAWGSLLLMRAGIPYRLGVIGYEGGHSAAQALVRFDPGEHVARMALRFAELLGCQDLPAPRPQIFLDRPEVEEAESWWRLAQPTARRARIVIAPGGGLPAKLWPAGRFAAVAAALAERHDVTVLTGPVEAALAGEVAGSAPLRLAPTPLRQAFAVIAAADLVVCNSSMAMHAAAAFAKPAVVLLGKAFPSAAAHQRQWGYPGLTRCLGREPGGAAEIASTEEAMAVISELLTELAAA